VATSGVLISVEQYLSTAYSPDREYVDGSIVERNVGERSHNITQREILTFLHARRKELDISVFPEQRVQVAASRFRIPDVCAYLGPGPQEEVFIRPPFLCIEILSKDDRAGDLQEKVDDYLSFGVSYVWVINPATRRAYIHTAGGSHEAKGGMLRTQNPDIIVPLAEIFSAL
jgi:Uma2 family endonuclease